MAEGSSTAVPPSPGDLGPLRELFLRAGSVADVLVERTRYAERIVGHAFERVLAPAFPTGMTLLAVGGFGRSELFPCSDIDLLLLVERPPASAASRNAISEFLRTGWDAGLRISHSVHTVAECLELNTQNVELTISLLDQRRLAGDPSLHQRLAEKLPGFVAGLRASLVTHLARLARERHARFQNTIYHLEPNIKETPGGMRDYHLVHWLERVGAAPATLKPELEPAWSFLALARCWLHFQSGRDNNLLTFEAQDEICALPFTAERDPAAWMRQYYRHARAIFRSSARALEAAEGAPTNLLRQFRDWRSRLSNRDFTVTHERVLLRTPSALASDPALVLRLFTFLARHGLRLAGDTERRIEEALPALEKYFAVPRPVWPALAEMFELEHAPAALQAIDDTGVLAALLPEWRRIDCLVVRDFYHRYTVDQHTLVAIDVLHRLRQPADDAMTRRFADLLEEIEHPAMLALAVLLHDLGKGAGGGHANAAVALSAPALERLGVPLEARAGVLALIERHLDLASVMTSRDLDDPATARWIADRAGTLEQLKQLTLVTYADVSAVNPTSMTPWRLEQLWRVYLLGVHELTRELDSDRIRRHGAEAPESAAFLEGFPTRYLRTHTPEQVARHMQLAQWAHVAGVALDLVRREGTWHLTVLASDRPGLLASIAGALASFGMNILKAEAFSNSARMILDTFAFADPMRTLELNPSEVERLRQVISDVVLAKADVRKLLRRRPAAAPRRATSIRPRVTFDSSSSATATLIEIVAQDRAGLLYDLASTISAAGCNIEVVLIDTEAHQALDVFYVTAQGAKLGAALERDLRTRLLAACGEAPGANLR